MSRDPLEELSAGLFEAARTEPPPQGAERRAFEAATRELAAARSVRVRSRALLLAAAFASLGLAIALWSQRDRAEVSIAAERPSSKAHNATLPGTSTPTVTRAAPDEAAPVATSATPKRATTERTVPLPPTLQDELEALRVAEKSLNAADPAAALKALDRYDRVLKGQKLRAEATLLRIEALSKAGQGQAAAELATRFTEQNPSSPLVDRARSFLKQPGLGGSQHEQE